MVLRVAHYGLEYVLYDFFFSFLFLLQEIKSGFILVDWICFLILVLEPINFLLFILVIFLLSHKHEE